MREPDIPRAVEKKMWEGRNIERALARKSKIKPSRENKPYCFICDYGFCNDEALEQHNRAKHGAF